MNIQLTGRLLATTAFLSLTAVGCQGEEAQTSAGDGLATQEAKATQSCLEGLEGITNCATGNAVLTRTEKGLSVSGLDNVKTDGVSSEFERATNWRMQAFMTGLGEKRQGLVLAARDGDQVVSTLRIAPGAAPGRMGLVPEFTGTPGGSAFHIRLYSNGQLVGSVFHGGGPLSIPPYWDYDYPSASQWLFGNESSLRNAGTSLGACSWSMSGAARAFSMEVKGETITGDSIQFIEVLGEGHYPYTSFSGIDVKAAATSFTILGESITRAD